MRCNKHVPGIIRNTYPNRYNSIYKHNNKQRGQLAAGVLIVLIVQELGGTTMRMATGWPLQNRTVMLGCR